MEIIPLGHNRKSGARSSTIKYIVIHDTEGTDSRNWLSQRDRLQPWNPKLDQNNVSIHYLVQRDGKVYSIVDEKDAAWHVGYCRMPGGETDGNNCSIGIELENTGNASAKQQSYTEAQLNAAAELVAGLVTKYKIDGKNVVSHASVALPPGRRSDPVRFDWGNFWDRIFRYMPKEAPVQEYSAQSPLLNKPSVDKEKVKQTLAKHSLYYTSYDVSLIVDYYYDMGERTGLDWVLLLAQSVHETGWFNSWWAQRPRRNPAGIGVTGQRSYVQPSDPQNWVKKNGVWLRGQSYSTWKDSAAHHFSRLLCYALTDAEMSPEQRTIAAISGAGPRLERLGYRGKAKQLVGLNGRWAVTGTTYAQTIAKIANSIVKASS